MMMARRLHETKRLSHAADSWQGQLFRQWLVLVHGGRHWFSLVAWWGVVVMIEAAQEKVGGFCYWSLKAIGAIEFFVVTDFSERGIALGRQL